MDMPRTIPTAEGAADRLDNALAAVRQRLGLLRWLLPVVMFVLVVVYELALASRVLAAWGSAPHIAVDIAVYGIFGPILAAVLLDLLGRWIEERETTAAQSLALAQARQQAQLQRELTDDTLQTLFAASAMLASLEDHASELPPESVARIQATHAALESAIQRQYAQLNGKL